MCLGSNSESLYMIPRLHMLIQALFLDISINQCGWRNIKAPSAQNVIHLAGSNTDYWSNIFVLTSFVRWGDSDLFTPPPRNNKAYQDRLRSNMLWFCFSLQLPIHGDWRSWQKVCMDLKHDENLEWCQETLWGQWILPDNIQLQIIVIGIWSFP